MANLSVTTECNRRCDYCFASGQFGVVRHIPLEEFERWLDFLVRSGIDQARLLGGEPTLHPEFPRLVKAALNRGLRLVVFSNGLMPETALAALKRAPADRVAVLLNATALSGEPEALRLGRQLTLGFNIHKPGYQPGFLLDLIDKHGLSRCIRFGLAHPRPEGGNRYLHPRHYRTVGERLAAFAEEAASRGVSLGLDCGFVPCMFPPGVKLGDFQCGPLPDLLPDGWVAPCYPLSSGFSEPLPPTADSAGLRERWGTRLSPFRTLSVLRECSECDFRRQGECNGGCLAAAMLRLRS